MSSLHAATPTNPAPPRTRARVTSRRLRQISRDELDVDVIEAFEARGHLSRHRHRPMAPTRASEGNDELRAAPFAIVRNCRHQGAFEIVEQLLGCGLVHDEVVHAWVAPVERLQLFDPVRIVQEPDIHHPRSAFGYSAFVSEGKARDEQLLARPQLLSQLTQLRDVYSMV